MTFGWQGFSFDHPDDWAPVTLTGKRKEGYVRLASPGTASLQIRWVTGAAKQLDSSLDTYFSRLRRDAQKQKIPFTCKRDPDESLVAYQYAGADSARGLLFHQASCGRIFFLEALGKPRDNLKALLMSAVSSFHSPNSSPERWTLLGLDVKLPFGLILNRSELRAGKTSLWLSQGRWTVQASRWGLAEQLLAKHSLEDWAKAVLGFRKPAVTHEEFGLRVSDSNLFGAAEAIVRHQAEQNQLIVVQSSQAKGTWRPEWDWLI